MTRSRAVAASTDEPIPLTRPSTDGRELAAVAEVLDSGWLAGQGPKGRELEEGFMQLTGRAHAVAVNNCTAALHLALGSLGVGPGDEVLVGDYSFPATAHAVLYCGATPVFVDVRADIGTIDVDLVPDLVTPRTRGIIGIDALGIPADWDLLRGAADRHGLFLVEDAACATGGVFQGQPCGSFGDIAGFSLHARKGITCGEGGVVTTDDAALASGVRRDSCFGMISAFERQASDSLIVPEFTDLGYNYKLADILAAIALVQLDKLDALLECRRAAAVYYEVLLRNLAGVNAPVVPSDREPTWQTYAITVSAELSRNDLIMGLRRRGIGTNIGTYALHSQPIYGADGAAAHCPVATSLFQRHLALPMYAEITRAQQERVVETLAELIAG